MKDSKNLFMSKGIIFAIITVIVSALGIFGFDVNIDDVNKLIALAAPFVAGVSLFWVRFTKAVQGFSPWGWFWGIVGALGGIYTAFTGDTEVPNQLMPIITQAIAAITSILSAFGIHVATKKVHI